MKPGNYINLEDSGLFRFVIVIVLILLLIFSVIKLYLANQPSVESVNHEMQKQSFINTLSLIRGQWLLEGRPSDLEFSFYDNQDNVINTTKFNMSSLGWASIDDNRQLDYCRLLWAAIINVAPQDTEKNTFISDKSHKNDDNVCRICDGKQRQQCLEYSTTAGIANQLNNR